MKRKIITVLVSMVLVLFACSSEKHEQVSVKETAPVTGVKTSKPVLEQTPLFYETTGYVKAKNTSIVSAKMMGTVEAIYVKEGQWVKKGEPLLKIYSPEVEAKVRQAEEAVQMAQKQKAFAEATYKRFEALYREKAISEQEFDDIKTKRDLALLQLKRAKAGLQEARAYESYTVVRAPQSGRVAEKKIDVGTMAAPGMPLFVLEEPRYQVVFSVDESLADKIKTGKEIFVSIKSLNYKGTVRVEEVSQAIDPMTRTFTVKGALPEVKGLRGGLFAEVKVPVGETKKLLVPSKAIFKWGALEAVYVVDRERTVHLRLVKTGKSYGENVEVLSGIEPEDE
ncbi:MAG: efflux RND transporter periplasmic adaptor subunit, partial [Nitrospirae bacterium]